MKRKTIVWGRRKYTIWIVGLVLSYLFVAVIATVTSNDYLDALFAFYPFIMLGVSIIISTYRLNDLEMTNLAVILLFVPLLGFLLILYLMGKMSDRVAAGSESNSMERM